MGRVRRGRGASDDRIEAFYRDHARDVYALLVSQCRDPVRAEDLMQDTFVRATRALPGYRGGSARAWLLAIARTTFLDATRRRQPEPREQMPIEVWHDPDTAERLTVQAVLDALPEAQRTALVLRDQLDLEYGEVGEALNRSAGAAKVLVHRARGAFRRSYAQMEVEHGAPRRP